MEETGVESLRQVAPNWSLGGDHKLLDILQHTHQRIISKCKEVTEQLDSMVMTLDDASISLQNVNNRFMALSNSQFIESRVYDDDADIATNTSPIKEPPQPLSLESDLQSLKRGLQILEDAHESLTILHDSDTDTESEDETAARTVLRPKDMYSDRPLPYIIGTQAWKNKWHAGLVCSDSDSDSSTSRRVRSHSEYSDSEPEPPPAFRPRDPADVTISGTSSERDETPPQTSLPVKQTPADMAAELARRLGGQPPKMTEQVSDYEPPPPTHKVYKPQQPTTVFSDEPPPLIYSSDSQDDDIFADLHNAQPYSTTQGVPDLFRFPHGQGGDGGSTAGRDSPKYEEGDIFSDFAKPVVDPSVNQSQPLFADQPNMLPSKSHPVHETKDTVDDGRSIKKPVGAISLFGTNKGAETIGAAILNRNRRKSSTSGDDNESEAPETPHRPAVQTKEKDIFDDLFAKSQKIHKEKDVVKDIKVVVKKTEVKDKKVDLFSDNIFDDIDDIFTTNVVKKPEKSQKSIFDDEDDLFSEVAAPKTVKSDVKSSDNKKSLFDSDDDELFSDKSKSINKDSAITSRSTNISKHNEQITKRVEITTEVSSKDSTRTNNSTKISKHDEEVTKEVQTTNDSTKISDMFDDGDDEDMFSNIKTNDKKVQNKLGPKNVASLARADSKSFQNSSLFDDDDDDLFTRPQSSKHTQKDAAISNQAKTDEIFENTDDANLFADATKSSNVIQKDRSRDGTDQVLKYKSNDTLTKVEIIQSSDNKNVLNTKPEITVKNTNKDTAKNSYNYDSASDVNIEYTTNSDVPTSYISHQMGNKSDEDDFEQDFDDIPPTDKDKIDVLNVSQTKITAAETKPSDIFDDTDDIFVKPAQKYIDNNIKETSSTDNPEFKDINNTTASFSKIKVDNTQIRETVTENIHKVTDKTHIQPDIKEEPNKAPKTITKISHNVDTVDESPSKAEIYINIRSKTPENGNNNSIFNDSDPQTSVFEDIFTEPPVFEKPKERKRSKNVNALFDDDSDDEALFFKKNDAIIVDEPDLFKLDQDRFDIFIDEPPDVDLDAKISTDDELFSSIPVMPSTYENADKNQPKHTDIKNKSTDTIAGLFKNESDEINVTDDDLFKTLPKPAIPKTGIENLIKNSVDTQNIHITAPDESNNAQDSIGNELSRNIKADLDDDIFKTLPKTAIKPTGDELGGDEGLFRLPKVETSATTLPKSGKSPKLPKKFTNIGSKSDTLSDDEELFKSRPNSKKSMASRLTPEINKSDELKSQSDNVFKTMPKDEPVTSLPKNENKADSDEELFKSLPSCDVTLPQNATLPQKTLESNTEESPKKVGKLKSMNFNINVNALLPGASPKKQKTDPNSPTEPTQKLDSKPQYMEQDSTIQSEEQDITEHDSNYIAKCDSNIEKSDSKAGKLVSFNDETESGILDNKLSKERAKIQVKRRPSTRRARREAVRKSAIDLGDDSTDNSSSLDDPPKTHRRTDKHEPETHKSPNETKDLDSIVKNTEKVTELSEKSSPKTHTNDKNISENIQTRTSVVKTENQPEIIARSSSQNVNTKIVYILNDEDIFNTPASNPGLNTLGNIYTGTNLDSNAGNLKSAGIKINTTEVDSTHSTSKSTTDERNSIKTSKTKYKEVSISSNVVKSTKAASGSDKKGIFDSDSDEELFTVKRGVKKVVQGPLFHDDDDDELFGVKKRSTEPKLQPSRSTLVREPHKPTEPVFEDPLSMLGDDD